MRVVVRLAGVQLDWSFRGSHGIREWLAGLPDSGSAQVGVLRARDAPHLPELLEALRMALDSVAGPGKLALVDLRVGDAGIPAAIMDAMSIPRSLPLRERMKLLVSRLRGRPHLLVLRGRTDGQVGQPGLTSCQENLDIFRQHMPRAAPAMLLVDTVGSPAAGEAWEFSAGLPLDAIEGAFH